ncbi:MAG: head-tail adaptor protein [Alphaproteobacteria bacterium]|nr:MAG: head-tail adaptor protein [Alphaproteobacteria bacterium]
MVTQPEIGALDRRMTIRTATRTRDAYGQEIETWADAQDVWAAVEWVSDGERWRAGERGVMAAARAVVRWQAGLVTHQDRVTIDGTEYAIDGIKEKGRRRWLEITLKRIEA